MKKWLSIVLAAVLVCSVFIVAPSAAAAPETSVYYTFDSGVTDATQISWDGADPTISQETASPLIGNGSLKLTMPTMTNTWAGTNVPLDGSATVGWTGLAMRVNASALTAGFDNSLWLLVSPWSSAGGAPGMFHPGKYALIDKQGHNITSYSTGDNGTSMVRIPGGFDGWVFMQFAGNVEYSGGEMIVPGTSNVIDNLAIGIHNGGNNIAGRSVYIDQIATYKGVDYTMLTRMLTDSVRTSVISTFEMDTAGVSQCTWDGANVTIAHEKTNSLIGQGSLKMTMPSMSGTWAAVNMAFDGSETVGWTGLAMRVDASAVTAGFDNQTWLQICPWSSAGGSVGLAAANTYKLLDIYGNDITATSDGNNGGSMIRLPIGFNGWVMMSFSGNVTYSGGEMIIPSNSNIVDNIAIGISNWYFNPNISGRSAYIDQISLYKGTDLRTISNLLTVHAATQTLNSFDTGITEVSQIAWDGGASVTTSYETTGALIGTGSLKMTMPYLNNTWAGINVPLDGSAGIGWTGISMRVDARNITSGLNNRTWLLVSPWSSSGGAPGMFRTGTYKLINEWGVDVTSTSAGNNGSSMVQLPEGFNGWVFMEFAQNVEFSGGEMIVPGTSNIIDNLAIGFSNSYYNDNIQNRYGIVDHISFYRGRCTDASVIMRDRLLFAPDSNAYKIIATAAYPAMDYSSTVKAYFYNGLNNYSGQSTRVFAYFGMPANASPSNPVPAVVLVHGGGGTAFPQWVQKWVDRGYAAIAMDTYGSIPNDNTGTSASTYDAYGYCVGPDGTFSTINQPQNQQWMYYAVADAIIANSWLRSDSRIDKNKIGITGISWGGLISSLALTQDRRFAFGVPVYGCGFLQESKAGFKNIVSPGNVAGLWDPSVYFKNVTTPTLWVNSDHDPHFSVDANSKSSMATGGTLSILPDLAHSHPDGWNQPEIYRFADSIVYGSGGLISITKQPDAANGRNVVVKYSIPAGLSVASAYVYYANSAITYQVDGSGNYYLTTSWVRGNVTLDTVNKTVSVTVPVGTQTYYVNITETDGSYSYTTSTRVVSLS